MLPQQTKQNLKQNAKKIAQAFADEPLEILKTARQQIAPEELRTEEKRDESRQNTNEPPKEEQEYKKKLAENDGRKLQALESELRDIRRQKIFNELLVKIQSGVNVSVEEFQELSVEQRDVLKAQLEATKNRNSQTTTNQQLPETGSKRGRQMGGGQRGVAKKQTTRVEKPVPPSG